MKKIYIGDSVYAEIRPGSGVFNDAELILTTENGYPDDPRNRIILGPSEWENLLLFVKSVSATAEKEEA